MKLRELIGKATGHKVKYSTIVSVPGDVSVVDLHLYLVHNAEAIADLIEAAERVVGWDWAEENDREPLHDIDMLRAALAALA